jgi:HPt (histidine-containing phosphotransfer) domain-containing protein
MMLARFEKTALNDNLIKIAEAINNKAYDIIERPVHTIKGSCGYVGASRLQASSFLMLIHYRNGNFETMIEYYPALIEAVIEYKIFSR